MIASDLDGGHALGFAPEREPTFASPLLVTVLVYCMYVVEPMVGTPGLEGQWIGGPSMQIKSLISLMES